MIDIATQDSVTLRFQVGDRVECNCGEWKRGTIVKLFYTQKSFPEGKCAPYQVRLEETGRLIFAPLDEDRVVRLAIEQDVNGEEDDEEEVPDADKLPVTVITGFLGAGKTTLLNYILNEQHGKRICVIENEFGAVNIDEALVKENLKMAEEVMSLDNGCACCTVRGDLLRTLIKLKDRKADFDLVLVETTGLADPAPIVATFTADPKVFQHYRVDGIVTLVDSKHIKEHLDEVKPDGAVNEAVQQVAFADRILINKKDLVTAAELRQVKETIFAINAFAEQVVTERSIVDLSKIMDISAFSVERLKDDLKEYEDDITDEVEMGIDASHGHGHAEESSSTSHEHGHEEPEAHGHGHEEPQAHGHGHDEGAAAGADCDMCEMEPKSKHEHSHAAPKKKRHDLSGVGSIGLTADKLLDGDAFNRFMSDILRTKARDLYRSKGVLAFAKEGDTKYIFQGVHEQIQYTTAKEPWKADEPKISKIVFIGKDLDLTKIEADFKKCLLD